MKLCHEYGVKVMHTRYLVATAGTCTCFVILVADDYQWKVYWKPLEWASTVGRDWFSIESYWIYVLCWRSFGENPWDCFPRIIDYCFLWDRGGETQALGFAGWIMRIGMCQTFLVFFLQQTETIFFVSAAVILQVENSWITLSTAAKSVYIFTYYWEALYNLELSHVQNALILYLPNCGGKHPTSQKLSAVSQQTPSVSAKGAALNRWRPPSKTLLRQQLGDENPKGPVPTLMRGGHWPSATWFPLRGRFGLDFLPRPPGKQEKRQGCNNSTYKGWKKDQLHLYKAICRGLLSKLCLKLVDADRRLEISDFEKQVVF